MRVKLFFIPLAIALAADQSCSNEKGDDTTMLQVKVQEHKAKSHETSQDTDDKPKKKKGSNKPGGEALLQEEAAWDVKEPPINGVFPSPNGRPHLIMAQDIDWPPYAYMATPPESDFDVAGIGHDMIQAMGELCNFDVTVVQTNWGDCWDNGAIGTRLLEGVYHGCMTYTHTVGMRNRFMEFSDAVLMMNKPAGLITRLDGEGNPIISGNNNLNGVRVVDVTGWAPTPDTLMIGINDCSGERFADFHMIDPVPCEAPSTPNDCALQALLDGQADVMWLYADQGYNYRADQPGVTPEWDVEMWSRFGQPNGFAYIHTGMLEHTYNGTTIAMSRKGSGVADFLNPCIDKFLKTQEYVDICHTHHVEASCFPNKFSGTQSSYAADYTKSTPELTTTCADGYCPCPAPAAG